MIHIRAERTITQVGNTTGMTPDFKIKAGRRKYKDHAKHLICSKEEIIR